MGVCMRLRTKVPFLHLYVVKGSSIFDEARRHENGLYIVSSSVHHIRRYGNLVLPRNCEQVIYIPASGGSLCVKLPYHVTSTGSQQSTIQNFGL
ncbi:hypothetical protein GOP47_0009345 [Adiantum capillus-veneris]|uniref:Uncharacterized protein n=1 Tax=Adiantum capillus-veneris TaxID=13818 RepID=A0A9D4UWQ2_ADICA|nr:hypothetical protein GOP47_0009345 [Adiantum capillus-veneris]